MIKDEEEVNSEMRRYKDCWSTVCGSHGNRSVNSVKEDAGEGEASRANHPFNYALNVSNCQMFGDIL